MNKPTSTSTITSTPVSRRRFLKHSSVAVVGAAALSDFPWVRTAHAAPDDPIRIGLIGCGGRGTGALADALGAATKVVYPQAGYHTEDLAADAAPARTNVKVIALADVFPDRLNACREQLAKLKFSIPNEMCFTGFDAAQERLKSLLQVADDCLQHMAVHWRRIGVRRFVGLDLVQLFVLAYSAPFLLIGIFALDETSIVPTATSF